MINYLCERNLKLIEKFKKLGDEENLERQVVISHLLENVDCFKMIKIEMALSILLDLGFEKEEAMEVYKKLI